MKREPPTSIRIDPALKKRLEKISKTEGGRSISSIIKQAAEEFVARWEARNKKK